MSHKGFALPTVGWWAPWEALSRERTQLDLKYRNSALLKQGDWGVGFVMGEKRQAGS